MERVEELLRDAEVMYEEALNELERWRKGEVGRFREGAEKAWCATFNAARALILVILGVEPDTTREARIVLKTLSETHPEIEKGKIHERFMSREGFLHGACFYGSYCEPFDENEKRIMETRSLIEDIKGIIGSKYR